VQDIGQTGSSAAAAPQPPDRAGEGLNPADIDAYLADARRLTLDEIRAIIPTGTSHSPLYEIMLDYPLREAKALRPALCMAVCRALGGWLEPLLRSAAVLELFHNAFLIHDDVEDGSEDRRAQPTLHRLHGTPMAVNVGDAMLALALQPLLDNMRVLGLGKALRVMQVIARMARESTEGQAMELHWIRNRQWQLNDTDYVRMVYKKTSWYTFVSPVLIGGIVAGAPPAQLRTLRNFAALLGIAFQVQDDVLNLTGEGGAYGKEIAGDLWEGKHTLIIMHMMRKATPRERARARGILTKPRPRSADAAAFAPRSDAVSEVLTALQRRGEISAQARRVIATALARASAAAEPSKTSNDIAYLLRLIERYGSIGHARRVGQGVAERAQAILSRADWLARSVHRDFLDGLVSFVVNRNR
jgi:geranylgeranyl diphosphate synthase, type II